LFKYFWFIKTYFFLVVLVKFPRYEVYFWRI
jgi:hypothetical protein